MAKANQYVILRVPRDYVDQALSDLIGLIKQRERTAYYLDTGVAEKGFHAFRCSNSREARALAEHYRQILRSIVDQLLAQSCL